MGVHKKLMEARLLLQHAPLKKSGHNKFAGYQYFELGDFLPTINQIFARVGLCGVVSFDKELATLTITDTEDSTEINFQISRTAVTVWNHRVRNGIAAKKTTLSSLKT